MNDDDSTVIPSSFSDDYQLKADTEDLLEAVSPNIADEGGFVGSATDSEPMDIDKALISVGLGNDDNGMRPLNDAADLMDDES